jgi:hypothetical protein
VGMFTLELEAVGGHGCQRELKDQASVESCGWAGCPDCILREAVAKLKASGASVSKAILRHWPGSNTEVSDNLLTKVRRGSF